MQVLAKYCSTTQFAGQVRSETMHHARSATTSAAAQTTQLPLHRSPSLTWKRSGVTVQLLPPMATATSQGRGPCCSCGGVVKRTASLLTYVPSTIVSPRGEVRRTRTLPSLPGWARGDKQALRATIVLSSTCLPH